MTERRDPRPVPVAGNAEPPVPALPGILVAEIESAATYAKASRASSTQRVYASDWKIFLLWCDERSIAPPPADPRAVASFLAAEADRGTRPSTMGRD